MLPLSRERPNDEPWAEVRRRIERQELAEAVRWHEDRRPGCGGRLFDEVVKTFRLIEAYPEIGSHSS